MRGIALAILLSGIATVLVASPEGNGGVGSGIIPRAVEPLSAKSLDRIKVRLNQQLREPSLQIQQGADPDVIEGGYAAPYHGHNEPWNDILQVTRPDNPLLTEGCRDKALERVLDNASDRRSTLEHLRGQIAFWDQVRQGARQLRLSEILLHVSECRNGCSAYMSGMVSCHIEAVRQHPRTIVYFETDRPTPNEEYRYLFDPRDERRIVELARQALAQDRDIVLFSRVSGVGAFDPYNVSGNNPLAWRRARAVDRRLIAAGVPRDRIHWKILSWETPRLAASEVARAYGFLDDWRNLADKDSMDQSVVLVVH